MDLTIYEIFSDIRYLFSTILTTFFVINLIFSNIMLYSNHKGKDYLDRVLSYLVYLLVSLSILCLLGFIFSDIIGYLAIFALEGCETIIIKMDNSKVSPGGSNQPGGGSNQSGGGSNQPGNGSNQPGSTYWDYPGSSKPDSVYNNNDSVSIKSAYAKIKSRWGDEPSSFQDQNAFTQVEGDINNLNIKEQNAIISAVNEIKKGEYLHRKGDGVESKSIPGYNNGAGHIFTSGYMVHPKGENLAKGGLLRLEGQGLYYAPCNMPENKPLILQALEKKMSSEIIKK